MSPLSEYRNAVCKTTYSVWYSKKWGVKAQYEDTTNYYM